MNFRVETELFTQSVNWYVLAFYPLLKDKSFEELKEVAKECDAIMAENPVHFIHEPVFEIPSIPGKKLTGVMVFALALTALYLMVGEEDRIKLSNRYEFLRFLTRSPVKPP
jgi:hypothetical protein